jgi:catechol 2,3-dioxygenase-like lactoylglutathione lyase family enzyme
MSDPVSDLFNDFDRGQLSRRQLLQALGFAAVGMAVPMRVFGQGRCGGNNAGAPECDKTPAKAPFDPTGWKTVSMDHFGMQAQNYAREAAYYAALMNWKVRSDDGKQAVLDIGDDVGTVIIRGGYMPPPVQAPPPRPPAAAGDSAAGAGRGGGRGGGAPRQPVAALWDSFCFGIDQWDAKKVEAALKARGLDPMHETDASGYEAFAVTDPGGFTVKVTDGKRRRRAGNATAKLTAPAPFENTNWKTVWLDHISFNCPNYKESVAFYQALLGWKPNGDEGSQNECQMGDVGNIIVRGGGPQGGRGGGPAQSPAPRRIARIDHISFGISPWDVDAVKAELDKRGLSSSPDTGGRLDIHDPAAKYKSYHTITPDGWNLQISNATRASREVR